jgi:hypothetical protein
MRKAYFTATALTALAFAAAGPDPAAARIACEGGFQMVRGQPVATPYCQDENLAKVARTYGIRVSAETIRRSESTKASVCRTIGHDNRVRTVCQNYRFENGGRRF